MPDVYSAHVWRIQRAHSVTAVLRTLSSAAAHRTAQQPTASQCSWTWLTQEQHLSLFRSSVRQLLAIHLHRLCCIAASITSMPV